MTRFLLDHQSVQSEAALQRNIHCQVFVIASGNELHKIVNKLALGNNIRVEGYLNQISFQGANRQLCVNAENIQFE